MSTNLHADPPPPIVREPHGIQYMTDNRLGKGGFAICYRAEQCDGTKRTGKIVALKIVKSRMEPEKLAQKFVTELQLHSKLGHPNIVEFYRAFSFEQSTYVVLEICDNGSLADALKRRKFFTMPEIRRFLIQTCGAVKYLHHRNIVHRDLKTGNLFLNKDMNIKVGDFGLAALLVGKSEVGLRRTTMCGTPNYLAPEILEKHGKGHNEKVDLWAIGIIAYTLAVGKAPFHASKREEIYKKLQQRDYSWPDLKKHQNYISTDLQNLVGSLLVDEDNRPCPDQIVSHKFFKMEFTPEQLQSECTERPPHFPNNLPPSAETIARGYSTSWWNVCKASGVGEFTPGRAFPVVGMAGATSIFKDVEREIRASRQPTVPIASGTVYLPFITKDKEKMGRKVINLSEIAEEKEASQASQLTESSGNSRLESTKLQLPRRMPSRRHKENVDPEVPLPPRPQPEPRRKPRVPSREVLTENIDPEEPAPPRPQPEPRRKPRGPSREILTEHIDLEEQVPVKPKPEARSIVPKPQTSRRTPSLEVVAEAVPSRVLERATQLRDNLLSCLAGKPGSLRSAKNSELPFVSKWVDYAKKHGVGYVLADGTIGCTFNATDRQPVIHAVVRNGASYLDKSSDGQMKQRVPFEFYTAEPTGALKSANLEGDLRKQNADLWAKFGRYMCQTLMKNSDLQKVNQPASNATSTIVRYYQRLGNVGLWGFSNGCLQLNFPDHTKIVISADGKYCDFTCLSVESMDHILQHGSLPMKLMMKHREVLSGSIQSLLHGPNSERTRANVFRDKIQFVINVVTLWIKGGGLGRRPDGSEWPAWTGPALDDAGGKNGTWITVGRFGGDI